MVLDGYIFNFNRLVHSFQTASVVDNLSLDTKLQTNEDLAIQDNSLTLNTSISSDQISRLHDPTNNRGQQEYNLKKFDGDDEKLSFLVLALDLFFRIQLLIDPSVRERTLSGNRVDRLSTHSSSDFSEQFMLMLSELKQITKFLQWPLVLNKDLRPILIDKANALFISWSAKMKNSHNLVGELLKQNTKDLWQKFLCPGK